MFDVVNRRAGDRLSLFPDSQRMLLQSATGIYVVSVSERHIEKVLLPDLVDVELGNAQITDVYDASAGPSNDEITFSGFIKDNAQVEYQRTYSCKLDGSGLKVLATHDPYPAVSSAYLPVTKTAFGLSKAMAASKVG